MRVLITGAGGQLGYDLVRILSSAHQVVAKTHSQMDVSSAETEVDKEKKADGISRTAQNFTTAYFSQKDRSTAAGYFWLKVFRRS